MVNSASWSVYLYTMSRCFKGMLFRSNVGVYNACVCACKQACVCVVHVHYLDFLLECMCQECLPVYSYSLMLCFISLVGLWYFMFSQFSQAHTHTVQIFETSLSKWLNETKYIIVINNVLRLLHILFFSVLFAQRECEANNRHIILTPYYFFYNEFIYIVDTLVMTCDFWLHLKHNIYLSP